jgi:hypothetical protein
MRSPVRLLLAAVSALALILVPGPVSAHPPDIHGVQEAPSPSPRPDLKGKRVRCDGGSATFLIDPQGYRRGIPTAAVGTKLFADTIKLEQGHRTVGGRAEADPARRELAHLSITSRHEPGRAVQVSGQNQQVGTAARDG